MNQSFNSSCTMSSRVVSPKSDAGMAAGRPMLQQLFLLLKPS